MTGSKFPPFPALPPASPFPQALLGVAALSLTTCLVLGAGSGDGTGESDCPHDAHVWVGVDSGKDSPPSVKLSQGGSLEKEWPFLGKSGKASQRR